MQSQIDTMAASLAEQLGLRPESKGIVAAAGVAGISVLALGA